MLALTAAHSLLAEILHVNAMAGILPDLQVLPLQGAQQVRERFIVDLQEAALALHCTLDTALHCSSTSVLS